MSETQSVLVREIIGMIKRLDTAGDIIIEMENQSNKELEYVYSKDPNGEYHIKIFKKGESTSEDKPNIVGNKIKFMLNVTEEVYQDDSM